jgi:phosphatidate cytidylyltransferase
MSPEAAMRNEVFRTYCVIVVASLALTGLILAIITWVLKKDCRAIWLTYKGWLLMVPVIAVTVFLGRAATLVFFTVIAGLGFKEFARATGLYRDWWMTGAVYLCITGVGIVSLIHDPNSGHPGWYGLFMTLPIYAIALLILVPVAKNQPTGQVQVLALAILGFLYLGWMFLHLAYLANADHAYGYLLYLLLAVELNDVAAFTFGKLFGKHPLRSNISPNKTWEGALGALAFSLALPWCLRFSFPHFGPTQLILAGLIVGIGGQLGDLSISVIKRDIGIKDMGASIPGHGGVLDRVDSLVYSAPLFLHMVDYYYKIF